MTETVKHGQVWQHKNRGFRVRITGVDDTMVNGVRDDGGVYAIVYGVLIDDFVLVEDAT